MVGDPEYITFVHFGIYLIALISAFVTIYADGRLLFAVHCRQSQLCVKELSKTMHLYLVTHICGSGKLIVAIN